MKLKIFSVLVVLMSVVSCANRDAFSKRKYLNLAHMKTNHICNDELELVPLHANSRINTNTIDLAETDVDNSETNSQPLEKPDSAENKINIERVRIPKIMYEKKSQNKFKHKLKKIELKPETENTKDDSHLFYASVITFFAGIFLLVFAMSGLGISGVVAAAILFLVSFVLALVILVRRNVSNNQFKYIKKFLILSMIGLVISSFVLSLT